MRTLVLVLSLALLAACGRSPDTATDTATDEAAVSEPPVPTVRFATYNVGPAKRTNSAAGLAWPPLDDCANPRKITPSLPIPESFRA
ncbi:MAG: hypothetical protein ACK4RW_03400 [Rehaibacterium terrae]|uniref:hypothetical protein n=1 Tax=Rehaibacterium terrae TaxID=1341696 RepID=UPI00391CD637